MSALPYRPNVGAVLFNRDGRVFVARRADLPNAEGPAGGWQLPQGGIDPDEDPRAAVLRELAEEIGTDRAEIIGEHPEWLTYDLPPELVGVALGGRYRGQTQRWFALRFTGEDSDIRLDADPDPEFDAWRWADAGGAAGAGGGFQAADLSGSGGVIRPFRHAVMHQAAPGAAVRPACHSIFRLLSGRFARGSAWRPRPLPAVPAVSSCDGG